MSEESNSKESNGEFHRKFIEGNCRCSEDLLPQIYNSENIPAFDEALHVQGFLQFFENMLDKIVQKSPNADFQHELIHIFEKWANLTDENRNVIICFAIIQNQEDCHVPLPDDLDVQRFMLITFNVLECIVESLLENYEKYPTNNPVYFETQKLYENNTLNYNIENNVKPLNNEMVQYPENTTDESVDEKLIIDFRVNLLEAYVASQMLLNLDENVLLE